MTKKKLVLNFLLAFVLILPFMFFMTACDDKNGDSGSGAGTGGSGGSGGAVILSGNEEMFHALSNIKFLPDYTEDFTITISETINSEETEGENDPVETKTILNKTISYCHNSQSSYCLFEVWEDKALTEEEIEYVTLDNEKYLYCWNNYNIVSDEIEERYAYGDATYPKGICECRIMGIEDLVIIEQCRDVESYSEFCAFLENVVKVDSISFVNNNDGTYSVIINRNETDNAEVIFNTERVLSIIVNSFKSGNKTPTLYYENTKTIEYTFIESYDNNTVTDFIEEKNINMSSASALDEVIVFIDALRFGYEEFNYEIGESLNLDTILAEFNNLPTGLTISGLYYDEDLTQQVDLETYKVGYRPALYAKVVPVEGYAQVWYDVEAEAESSWFPFSEYVIYDLSSQTTMTAPLNYLGLKNASVLLTMTFNNYITPLYPYNYKIFYNNVQLSASNNEIALESEGVYHFRVTMLAPEEGEIINTVDETTWQAQMSANGWDSADKFTKVATATESGNEEYPFVWTIIADGLKIKSHETDSDSDDFTEYFATKYDEQNGVIYNRYTYNEDIQEWIVANNAEEYIRGAGLSYEYFFEELTEMFSDFQYNAETKTYSAHYDNKTLNYLSNEDFSIRQAVVQNLDIEVSFENGIIKTFSMTTDGYQMNRTQRNNGSPNNYSKSSFDLQITFGVGEVTLPEVLL